MAHYSDWLPRRRTEQLTMGKNWRQLLQAPTPAAGDEARPALQSIVPPVVVQELSAALNAAEDALAVSKNEETRTPVANVRCKTAFAELEAKLRDIKKRWFFQPPLTNADFAALGLKPHDAIPTPGKIPWAQVRVETYLIGRHELGVKIVYLTGDPKDLENKGYRIWYNVAAPGGNDPASPGDLHNLFYTQRKKDVIEFDTNDSGKTVWFAVQVENDGKKGPWGPLVSALIP